MAVSAPKLSLGPILYYWSRDTVFRFYERIAATPVDIVYLGETVCSKRRILNRREWLDIAARLEQNGKQVVLSSLALIEARSELGSLRHLCENGRFLVEANDLAAVQMLAHQVPFVAGPTINIYNDRSLRLLAGIGLKRWVAPVELSRSTIAAIAAGAPGEVETEVFAYGRLPLAYSARCFTARAHNLPKDDCQFCCQDYADGLSLSTQEEEPFLVFNGIQTQSARTYSLLDELGTLRTAGIDILRISPQSDRTERIIELFDRCIRDESLVDDARHELAGLAPAELCDGYWNGVAGMEVAPDGGRRSRSNIETGREVSL